MSQTLRVEGQILCEACCDQVLPKANADAPEMDVERQFDPTVCANCKADHGTTELSNLAGVPMCDQCQTFFRNRPFPAWTKVALAAVVVLVGVSFVWNLRFFRAHSALNRSFASLAQGDLEAAASLMDAAHANVPESEDLLILATYMKGIALLSQDKCGDALILLKQCKDRLPPEYEVEAAILRATAGAAFDNGDYHGFLAAAQAQASRMRDDFMGPATVASAWACKYAESGDPTCRQKALDSLKEARDMAQDDPSLAEYENRILHRLHTRQIVTPEQFYERFPQGWSPEKED